MQIDVVRPAELGSGEIAAWHAMQRGTVSLANPFLSPEFAIAVGRVRPRTRVAILTDGAQTCGFFAFERQRLRLGVPIAPGLTDCQGLIHAPGAEWDPRQLLRACGISGWRFDHLVSGQRSFERFQAALAASPVIDLGRGFAAYHRAVRARSPGFIAVAARKARKLARELGGTRFEVDTVDAAALRLLMSWKSAQYRRTGRPDRFAEPWIVGLVEALAATRCPGLSGLLSVLYAGDRPLAAHFGVRAGAVLAYWFPAYDPAFSKYSPGLIALLRLAEEAAARGVRLIDLGKGEMRYKQAAKSADLFVGEGIVTGRSPLSAVHWTRVVAAQRAVRTVRGNQRLFEVADWVLRRYGRSRQPPVRAVTGPAPAAGGAPMPAGHH